MKLFKNFIKNIRSGLVRRRVVGLLNSIRIDRKRVTLYELLVLFFEKARKEYIIERAQAVAFSFTLAVFPASLFLFTLIPYIPVEGLEDSVMGFMQRVMPPEMFNTASETLKDILSRRRGGLLSLGFFLALFMSADGMVSMMNAFNRCYKTIEKRNFFQKRLIALVLIFFLFLAMVLTVIIRFVGGEGLRKLKESEIVTETLNYYLLKLLGYGSVIFLLVLAVAIIYYFAPAVRKRWRFFSAGTIVASVLTILTSSIFSFYLNNFAAYNTLYGSIGALIGLIIWFFIIALVLMVGFEINASLDIIKKNKEEV